ncbi:MAG TPA: hypothetical protein VF183_04730 [Acidimicrobiales bacterium]
MSNDVTRNAYECSIGADRLWVVALDMLDALAILSHPNNWKTRRSDVGYVTLRHMLPAEARQWRVRVDTEGFVAILDAPCGVYHAVYL